MYSLKEEKISQITPFSVLADNKRIRNKIIDGKSTQATRSGKNLFKLNSTINATINGIRSTFNEETGKVNFNGTLTSTYTYTYTNPIYFDNPISSGIYTFSFDSECDAFVSLRGQRRDIYKNYSKKSPRIINIRFFYFK